MNETTYNELVQGLPLTMSEPGYGCFFLLREAISGIATDERGCLVAGGGRRTYICIRRLGAFEVGAAGPPSMPSIGVSTEASEGVCVRTEFDLVVDNADTDGDESSGPNRADGEVRIDTRM